MSGAGRGARAGAPNRADPIDPDVHASCARSVADDAALEVRDLATDADDEATRGRGDRAALVHAHHAPTVHASLAPATPLAAALFDRLETERVEALGANRLRGVAANLDRLRETESARRTGPTGELARLARTAFRSGTVPPPARSDGRGDGARADRPQPPTRVVARPVFDPEAVERIVTELDALRHRLDDQDAFARAARRLAVELAVRLDPREAPEGAREDDGDGPVPGEPEPDDPRPAATDDPDDGELDETPPDLGEADARDDAEDAGDSAEASSEAEEGGEIADDAIDEAPVEGRDPVLLAGAPVRAPYRAYTTAFDQVLRPRDLADASALAHWRGELDRHLALQGRLVRRLAARLARALLAEQRREWQFDQEEGELDGARLARLVTSPLSPLAFRSETEARFRDTSVTLLIDNSRSMLGRPIAIAAAAADILAMTLERCGVTVEVLGFTTAELHGGRSTAAWEAAGRPPDPGRLNDLRHIVYKGADVPYRTGRRGLGLMLARDVLKQNIDGESLAWAHARLLARPERRRILMTISDGAPVDTATLAANPRDYLSAHLHETIAGIERHSPVELLAIGIGHDVGRFYANALTVRDARDLGPAMLERLEPLLRRAA